MTLGKQVRLFERRNMAHSKWWDTPKKSANLGCLFRGRRQGRQPLNSHFMMKNPTQLATKSSVPWSSTYSIQHCATTKQHSSYTIAPCDKHSTSIKKTLWLKPFFDVPNLRWGRQDFHQRAAQLCYSEPLVVGLCLHTTRSSQGAKLIYWYFRHSTTEPLNTLWNSSYAKFFQFGSQCNFLRANSIQHTAATKQHSSYNIEPCSKNSTLIIFFFLSHPTCVAKTSNNRVRSSPTASRFLSGPRPTFRALAILRSSSTEIPSRAPWSHSQPLVTVLLRSSGNRISTALDDAVTCSIPMGNPFRKWNSNHNAFTSVTGAPLEPNILHAVASMFADNPCHFHVVHQKHKPQHCAQLLATQLQSPLTPCNTKKVSPMDIVNAIITLTSSKATELHTFLVPVLSIIHPQPMSKSSVLSC